MASTYTQPKKNGEDLQEEMKKQVSAQQTAAQQSAANLQQISQQAASLGGYTPSAQLQQAQQRVTQLQQQKPAEFTSAYTQKLQDQFESIMNRQPFNYDLGTDPLWNQYSDMYVQKGRRAMQDTIGQAAALTGGYGNSYAQGAGQAAYGNYLQELNARAPEFQQQAYGRWQQEGADMLDRYNALQNRENIEYGRYQDALNNYWGELDRAQQQAADLYNREYTAFTNNREYAYNTALTMLQGGKMPSDGLLAAAGLSAEDAAILKAMYKPKKSSVNNKANESSEIPAQIDHKATDSMPVEKYVYESNTNQLKKKSAVDKETGKSEWTLTDTNVEDGILSLKDFKKNVYDNDAFAKGIKQDAEKKGTMVAYVRNDMEKTLDAYQTYVEDAIERDYVAGHISKRRATELANKYLK